MTITRPTLRPEVQRVIESHAIASLSITADRERWLAYEDAKRALANVCDSSVELAEATRRYVELAGL